MQLPELPRVARPERKHSERKETNLDLLLLRRWHMGNPFFFTARAGSLVTDGVPLKMR
jgi:hypothetical protein